MSSFTDLVSALAWPLVFVWFVNKYGVDIKELIVRLSRFKIGVAEAEFNAGLTAAEVLATEASVGNRNINNGNNNSEYINKIAQLERIADFSPRAAIMESWLMVEEAAGRSGFIQGGLKPKRNPELFIDWLIQEGKLEDSAALLLKQLRSLRNEAAHFLDFEITRNEAERYIRLAAKVSQLIVDPD
ncbi:DUF4145 domain-containing protein [Escherichia coli]|nr:DUF4145 domain-containing protein [Salmonella enterica]EJC6146901.1 DUF4145 domain-containing protein [Escherichia coli]